MKKLIFSTTIILISVLAFAQDNVGIGTTTPEKSAKLHISSKEKGLLIPFMNSLERTAISAPAEGLMVFDTDANSFWYYTGASWAPINAGYASIKSITGASATYDITDSDNTLIVDGLISRTINLPAASATASGRIYVIKAVNGFAITITPNGTDRIDGNASYVFSAINEVIKLQSDGVNWWIINKSTP